MRKNKNGFTLIELLAVIVIMGILAVMVIPKLSSLVLQTKEQIYLQDAKKLLAQAHYKMNSNSMEIEKPEKGECIVFSMKYLNINDFRNPPNDGNYMDESSFVVVRNNEDSFEYAVMIVEHRKDGLYQGVEFVTETQINARGSIKHVRYFDERDIRYIDAIASEEAGGVFIDDIYINSQLSKSGLGTEHWLNDNSIIGTYNRAKMKEGLIADASTPKFSAKITSRGLVNEIGTLNAVLTVSAMDGDDPLETLTVCTRVDHSSGGIYPTKSTTPELCEEYGNRKFYVKTIDFASYGFNYQDSNVAFVYVTVMDPSGNVERKLVEYQIHQNTGPDIKSMLVSKKPSDIQNMPKAIVQVDIVDDLDEIDDLQVCFHQDNDDISSCHGDYLPYNEVFDHNNQMEYTFKDENGNDITYPDGSSHMLYMFVMDLDQDVSVANVPYDIYKNLSPEIVSATLVPDTINGFNSLYYDLSLIITDDLNDNTVMVRIADEEPITYRDYLKKQNATHTKPYYRAPGLFNGEDREVVIKIWDEYQTEDDAITQTLVLDNVYQSGPPEVEEVTIEGINTFCLDDTNKHCNTKKADDTGGSYETTVHIQLFDYLISQSNLSKKVKICLSESEEGCDFEDESLFVPYSDSISFNFEKPDVLYAGDEERSLYISTIKEDSVGDETERFTSVEGPYTYNIYENKRPSFIDDTFTITSTAPNNTGNFKNVILNFSKVDVSDDFNTYQLAFCYKINNGEDICTDYFEKNQFLSNYSTGFEFKDSNGESLQYYEGQIIDAYMLAKDHLNEVVTSRHVSYELLMDEYPEIKTLEVTSNTTEYNANTVYFKVTVLDVGDTYKICVKEDGDGECTDEDYKGQSNGNGYSGDYVGNNLLVATYVYYGVQHGWSEFYEGESPNKLFHLYVRDTQGHVTEYNTTLSYTVYTSCIQNIEELRYETISQAGSTPISMNYCQGLCYKTSPLSGRPNNNISSNYNKFVYYRDVLIGYDCPRVVETEKRYCNNNTCFTYETNQSPYYIDLVVKSPNSVWTDSPAGEVMPQLVSKPYCDNYQNNNQLLFNTNDYRCKNSNYCSQSAQVVCIDDANPTTCQQNYVAKCNAQKALYCSKGLDEAMHPVNCSSVDLNSSTIVQRTCDVNFMDGYCYEDDSSCYVNSPSCTAEQISAGTCPQVLSDQCENVCYEKVNCAQETTNVQAVVTCHGYLYVYTASTRNGKMVLSDSAIRVCPEVIVKYPNHYKYKSTDSRPYVLFNSNEQTGIFG